MAALKKHQSHHPSKHHPAEASLQGHHERFHIRHRATDPPRRPSLRVRLKSYKAAVSRAAHGALGLLECVKQQQVESAPAERCFIFNLRFLQLVMGKQTSPPCGLHLGPLNGWRGQIKDPVNLVFYCIQTHSHVTSTSEILNFRRMRTECTEQQTAERCIKT